MTTPAVAGWYPGPGGDVLRWWTGWMWGPDVAALGSKPLQPPVSRRWLPHGPAAATAMLDLADAVPTEDLPIP